MNRLYLQSLMCIFFRGAWAAEHTKQEVNDFSSNSCEILLNSFESASRKFSLGGKSTSKHCCSFFNEKQILKQCCAPYHWAKYAKSWPTVWYSLTLTLGLSVHCLSLWRCYQQKLRTVLAVSSTATSSALGFVGGMKTLFSWIWNKKGG